MDSKILTFLDLCLFIKPKLGFHLVPILQQKVYFDRAVAWKLKGSTYPSELLAESAHNSMLSVMADGKQLL